VAPIKLKNTMVLGSRCKPIILIFSSVLPGEYLESIFTHQELNLANARNNAKGGVLGLGLNFPATSGFSFFIVFSKKNRTVIMVSDLPLSLFLRLKI